ncbi:MAG: CAP domain-containing protein, partial [Dehalococcoidia bacterium]
MTVGLLVVAALFVSVAASSVGTASAQIGQDEQVLLDLMNAHRTANGLAPLNVSPTLTDAAAWMSGDMAEKDYFSHTDSLGRDPFQRMADFGYGYNTWKGENLAAGSDTPQLTFQLWRDSPGHNANMLNPNFVVVGLAKAYGANSTYG